MQTSRAVSRYTWIALIIVLACGSNFADETSKPDPPAQAAVILGEPEWSTNIRNERWVRTHITVTNRSDRSYWVVGYSTKLLSHDYERRRSPTHKWERVIGLSCGTGAVAHEILPHSVFEFDRVLPTKDVGKEVRWRLRLYRRMEYVGSMSYPPVVKEPEECVSNVVLISRDTAGTQPDGAANGSQPIRSETNPTSPPAGSRR